MRRPELSVVVPCHNEAEGIYEFHRRLTEVMEGIALPWEVIYVNDGSTDRTLDRLSELRDRHDLVGYLNLSRNFGKEIALTAGLDHVHGNAVVVIDADLQDPPEIIPKLVAGWREGFDVVYAQRSTRLGETWLKRATANAFYQLMQRIGGEVSLPANTGDFRLLSRRAVDALLDLREKHRFMKGLFAWIGYPSKAVPYDRAPRHAGSTSWNYWQLWNLAVEGVTGFTVAPLKVATYLGLLVATSAIVYAAVVIFRTVMFGSSVPGYPSLMVVILFLGGTQLITLGVLGEYLGRVFNEAKQRPLYLVEEFVAPTPLDAESSYELPPRVRAEAGASGRARTGSDSSIPQTTP
ncbi:MAG: glycosyltransferase family 2 protein [Acetobacteraceae bacterium]|nr:glycosyltransferase family 2 protein [Acetobacteraceae bacterium]